MHSARVQRRDTERTLCTRVYSRMNSFHSASCRSRVSRTGCSLETCVASGAASAARLTQQRIAGHMMHNAREVRRKRVPARRRVRFRLHDGVCVCATQRGCGSCRVRASQVARRRKRNLVVVSTCVVVHRTAASGGSSEAADGRHAWQRDSCAACVVYTQPARACGESTQHLACRNGERLESERGSSGSQHQHGIGGTRRSSRRTTPRRARRPWRRQ